MSPAMRVILMMVMGAGASSGSHESSSRLPLALLSDRTLYAAPTTVQVPLLLVPSQDLALISDVHISSVSRSQPLVTCSLDKYTLEATPAVRVVLRRPVLVDSAEAALQFPSRLAVLHEGLKMSVRVGALLAPIPGTASTGPYLVRVLYAVPTSPLSLSYAHYAPYHYPPISQPNYAEYTGSYSRPLHTLHQNTVIQHTQAPAAGGYYLSATKPVLSPPSSSLPQRPQLTSDNFIGARPPTKGQVVTVLHFPEELATPSSLYYQPESEDELGNRNPPEAVIPAGIVQSAQPQPNLQLFINSKESPILQVLREEAEENRKKFKTASPNSITVEAL